MRTNKLLIFSVVVMSLSFVTCSRFLVCSNEEVKKEEPKEILSKDKTISKVALNTSPKVTATVDDTKITATVPFGTDLSKVTLAITHSGVSIFPLPKTPQDFSNGKSVTYTVKAEDGSKQEYTVSIGVEETILQSASISAFMGENGSDITISLKPKGDYKLYISNDKDCDIEKYKECVNSTLIEIDGTSKEFSTTILTSTTKNTTYFIVQDSKGSYKIIEKANVFSSRRGHQVVVFKNKMYLVAGRSAKDYKNDVYSSSDGTNWKQEIEHAAFSPRELYQVVVFKNKMHLIGGDTDSGYKNDVYSSSDGKVWDKITTFSPIFSPRYTHQVVVYKEKMYLTSGVENPSIYKNDVYSSSDGITWNEEASNAAFSVRYGHQVVVFNKKMYLIAGYDGSKNNGSRNYIYKNDVWSSSDGITWNKETSNAAFSARFGHQVVVFKDKMYLLGGLSRSSGFKNDVWSSSDGITWNEETSHAAFSDRYFHQLVVFKDKMYLLSGSTLANNNIWRSSDGITWKKSFGLTFTK